MANPTAPKVDGIDRREMAAQYGWALSVLNSDPGLAKKFNQAVKQSWSPQRFIAEVRSTQWFKTHSEAARNWDVLRTSDPATATERLNQTRALVRDAAVQMGAQMSEAEVTRLSTNVLRFGWNDSQIKDTMAGAIKQGAVGTYGGQAAANADQLQQVAIQNGVKLSDPTLRQWLVRIGAGESIDGFESYVRGMAKSSFPGLPESLTKQLDAGMNLADIADPYKQTMAQVLELNPDSIDMFDPTIRKALQATGPDGKPTSKPMWQFEQELKQDPRWMQTDNARDSLMTAGQQVLRDFGLAG